MASDWDLRARMHAFFASDEAPGVVAAYLFGSEARGTTHRESDVDVAVALSYAIYPSSRQRFERRIELGSGLIAALHRNEIDLLILNDTPPLLSRQILLEGELIWCSDPEAARAFHRDVLLRAADLEPFLRRYEQRKIEALRA